MQRRMAPLDGTVILDPTHVQAARRQLPRRAAG